MTPLANYFLKDWCKPKAKRAVFDPLSASSKLVEAKAFDCRSISNFFETHAKCLTASDLRSSGRLFLPAPVTWLEMNAECAAMLVSKNDDSTLCDVFVAFCSSKFPAEKCSSNIVPRVRLDLKRMSCQEYGLTSSMRGLTIPRFTQREADAIISEVAKRLFLINTPRIIGKKVHQPHAGLARKVASAQGMTGKFPLHAWTEIKLWCDADDISEISSDDEIEAHFTGQRCLHFVRSFLRWRNGQLERVKAHWRGNPALGMRRSRYICEPKPLQSAA